MVCEKRSQLRISKGKKKPVNFGEYTPLSNFSAFKMAERKRKPLDKAAKILQGSWSILSRDMRCMEF